MTCTADGLRYLQDFWTDFCRDPLYETGFADAVLQARADRAATITDALIALAYIHGSADTARLACPFSGRAWRIANIMGIIAGRLTEVLTDRWLYSPTDLARILSNYRTELEELARQPELPRLAAS